MQKLGLSIEESKRIIDKASGFEEGDRVKIDYDYIMGKKSAENLSEKYIEFISNNKDKVFTLAKDDKHKSFFVFEEDVSEPKWLWFGTDLIRYKEENVNE